MSFYMGCHQDELPRDRVCLLASHNPAKKIPYIIVEVACVVVYSRYGQVDNQE